ncbi:uncharacterized protein LY89DRAFT_713079 [Mollisia scopiformis]|uniref:2EXR domain-containing protein n=1 Tax=Mollisia scopiformis TaxID=149040 RepID=A0A194XVC6_MOLSC|nr:uncharacterized protein LY89DRAFT_713079 [Mollisia scopiformis]KUJ24173.1 hypothetical protein LY89DRAFT_713079 [Mollisia scopiformis]
MRHGTAMKSAKAPKKSEQTAKKTANKTASKTVKKTTKKTIRISKPLKEFTVFPKLPIELRLEIFGEAMPGPRVIEIMWANDHLYTDCPIPALLHTCAESRNLALKTFKKFKAVDDTISLVADDVAMPDEDKRAPRRLAVGFVKQDPARPIQPWRYWRSRTPGQLILFHESFTEMFQVYGKQLKDKMVVNGATEKLVDDLEFVGIDIIRSGMKSPRVRNH